MSNTRSADMEKQHNPKFYLRALNVFTKFVTLFVSDDVVHWVFDTSTNTIVLKALCQSNQAMLLCEMTGNGKPGDILGNIRHADGKTYKYKFDSKAIQLLMKHVNKACAISMVMEAEEDQLKITTRDKSNQPLTQHVLRSMDDGKIDEDNLDISEMIAGLEYPLEAMVNGDKFSRCMGVACDETSVTLNQDKLCFSTDHTALQTTMILPLYTMEGTGEYKTQFGKVATAWLAKVSSVCAFATNVHKTVVKHHNAQRNKKRKHDAEAENENEEVQVEEDENELQLKLFLSSTLPLGLHCSLGNGSSLRVYASSRNEDSEDDEE